MLIVLSTAELVSMPVHMRLGVMAAGIGWTRGVLDQAGLLTALTTLPTQLRLQLPSGNSVLGVHASPGADDGSGISPGIADERLRLLLAGCGADIVIGGHTHRMTDRHLDGIRALNPGTTGMSQGVGTASWLLLEDDGQGFTVTHRTAPFNVNNVVEDLHRRRHPNAEFVASILTGKRQ